MSSITLASCNLHSDDSSSSRLCETSGLHQKQETTTGTGTRRHGGPRGAAPPGAAGAQAAPVPPCPHLWDRLSPEHPLPGALHAQFPSTRSARARLPNPAAPMMLGDADSVSRVIQSSLKLLFNEM